MKRRTPLLSLLPALMLLGGLPSDQPPRPRGEDWPPKPRERQPTPEEDERRLAELDAAAAGHPAACLCEPCAERWRVVARMQSRRS